MKRKGSFYGRRARAQRGRKAAAFAAAAVLVCALVFILAYPAIDRAVRRKSGAGAFGGDGAVSFEIPVYAGEPFVEVNGGVPFFREEELTAEPFKSFSPLDPLGRCGPAMCCLGRESMPLEARGEIGTVRPSGWHTARYDDLIEDKYLYNRCHLIAYMLSGENDNALNLITGTAYMNTVGMLPFERAAADCLLETRNHVLYRVTPVFRGNNLVADGVLMEARSVEDGGAGLTFCVFVFNVQPGIEIDYADGTSRRSPSP